MLRDGVGKGTEVDPPRISFSFLSWSRPTAQSVEKQKATFPFLNHNDGRIEGVALPNRGSPGCPAPPAHLPLPPAFSIALEDEYLGCVKLLDYSSLYMCKPKRSMKRDDSKDTYKLPHRLIEKKRRDRINECIAQLKDLLPEHLKLTTLGHLEKAVVLELTLKHLKALTALTEQQHQKIIALQNGERSLKSPIQRLGCVHWDFKHAKESAIPLRFELDAQGAAGCVQLINHLHAVATQFLPTPQLLTQQVPRGQATARPRPPPPRGPRPPLPGARGAEAEPLAHCVPVIQRTQPSAELAPERHGH
ncbi:Class E basic helix-loop-helix protein 41 [Camelus dromedarius]|uniref:Class E basic helix-loop-helix protein 40 n=1 Tax=Camelus dromedarius TaxID=9838 RepID=A0A5N4C814_CAMDR|nr:Class E basic helix-loop-helix protein 41 [Camelus dromedarius]